MAPAANSIREHDVVVLRNPSGKWPPGTAGAVVSDYGDVKLIEIADERGVALDYVQVPASQLARSRTTRLPERWQRFDSGRPVGNIVAALDRSRQGR